jgi:hypothetical protein
MFPRLSCVLLAFRDGPDFLFLSGMLAVFIFYEMPGNLAQNRNLPAEIEISTE